jgi:hypothetical protein
VTAEEQTDRALQLLVELTERPICLTDTLEVADVASLDIVEWLFLIEEDFRLRLDDVGLDTIDKTWTVSRVIDLIVGGGPR